MLIKIAAVNSLAFMVTADPIIVKVLSLILKKKLKVPLRYKYLAIE